MNDDKPNPHPVSDAKTEIPRREFIEKLCILMGIISALILAIPLLGFVLGPLFERAPHLWRRLGPKDLFTVGKTVSVTFDDPSPLPWAGVTAKTAAWLRRESDDRFIAFSISCTHLGCPVRWMPEANLFMCPCHGGVFYADGTVAAGPPPRPLLKYPVRVKNGQVEILSNPIPIGRGHA